MANEPMQRGFQSPYEAFLEKCEAERLVDWYRDQSQKHESVYWAARRFHDSVRKVDPFLLEEQPGVEGTQYVRIEAKQWPWSNLKASLTERVE